MYKYFLISTLLLNVFFIIFLNGCEEKTYTIRKYNYENIKNVEDSFYTANVTMLNWKPNIPKIECYNSWRKRILYYNYEDNIINFQSFVAVNYDSTVVGDDKMSGVIAKIKNIDGKYKAFYIRWLVPNRKVSDEYNFFTDTTTISSNLSREKIMNLLPGFRGKVYSGLNDSLKFDFSKTHPLKNIVKVKYL